MLGHQGLKPFRWLRRVLDGGNEAREVALGQEDSLMAFKDGLSFVGKSRLGKVGNRLAEQSSRFLRLSLDTGADAAVKPSVT